MPLSPTCLSSPLYLQKLTCLAKTTGDIPNIPLLELGEAFLPVVLLLFIMHRWGLGVGEASYATVRMLAQLLLVGYVLEGVFDTNNAVVILAVLGVMLAIASSIALRPVKDRSSSLYLRSLAAIGLSGGLTLFLVTQGVLHVEPWFRPQYVVPLGGMLFTGTMNSVSLAAERYEAEMENGATYIEARKQAMETSLIPITNSLLAVGLVSLPGMMTGQILQGESPLLAARYQIMIMASVFGSGGLGAAIYLVLMRPRLGKRNEQEK